MRKVWIVGSSYKEQSDLFAFSNEKAARACAEGMLEAGWQSVRVAEKERTLQEENLRERGFAVVHHLVHDYNIFIKRRTVHV